MYLEIPVSQKNSLNIIVQAGAGAGKTTWLTKKVIEISIEYFKEFNRYPHIVVTTFTKKATEELKERLMKEALKMKDENLLRFFSESSALHISTIHGLLYSFLSRFSHKIGLNPSFSIIDTIKSYEISKNIFKQKIFENVEKENLLEIHSFNKLLEFAITYFSNWMKYPELTPLTFNELKDFFTIKKNQLINELETLTTEIQTETQHEGWLEFSLKLKQLAEDAKNSPTFHLDSIRKPHKGKKINYVSEEIYERVGDALSEIKELSDLSHSPSQWKLYENFYLQFENLALDFSKCLLEYKLKEGELTLEDLELITWNRLVYHPTIGELFSDGWDYWLIDEFQDTSPLQIEILNRLKKDKPSFFVGDPQQSIYLFRGARTEVFKNSVATIIKNGGETLSLLKNYRSESELLAFINDFFHPHFCKMDPASTYPPDHHRVVVKWVHLQSEDSQEERNSIVTYIQNLMSKNISLEKIAILARTHQTLVKISELLTEYQIPVHLHSTSGFYDRMEIQDFLALLKFLINPHDNLNLIQLLRSPWFYLSDDDIYEKIKHKPISYWEAMIYLKKDLPQSLQRLHALLNDTESLGISATLQKAITLYIDFSHHHETSGRREGNLWKLIIQLSEAEKIRGFNYLKYIECAERDLKSGEGENEAIGALEPYRVHLMTIHGSKGLEFDHVILPHMNKALRSPTLKNFMFDEENKKWALPLQAESYLGLQYPLNVQEWIKKWQDKEKEESDRLLYVAMTRAKKELFLTSNTNIDQDSWLGRFDWDLSEGIHSKNNYSYEVITQSQKPHLPIEKLNPQKILCRDSWKNSNCEQNILDFTQPSHLSLEKNNQPHFLKILKGLDIHHYLELLKNNHSLNHLPDDIKELIQFVLEIKEPPMIELIQNGHVEYGIFFKWNDQIIRGRLDLWGRDSQNRIWIVDYKTGSSRLKDESFKQLQWYAKGLIQCRHVELNETIHLCLIYVLEKRVFHTLYSP